MNETSHKVLALDVYNDKIKHLLEPESLPWNGRIHFHRLNIKNDSRLEGLIKMADLVTIPISPFSIF
jgi:UDP-apiose/xylose synthase